MTEQGVVSKIDGTHVTIECGGGPECSSCGVCGDKRGPRTIRALNAHGLEIAVGQIVEVFVSPYQAVRAAFLVLILPLVLFLACYGFGSLILGSELGRALCGVGGLGLGFLFNLLLRWRGGRKEMPLVSQVLGRSTGG